MIVIIKVNPIQNAPCQGSETLKVGRGCRKAYVDVIVLEKLHLEREFQNVWKILKLSTSSIKFHWRQQLLSEISKVVDI